MDIGDEQSIEQSLSTFSSHMVNLIRILEKADDHSLVLLDELGAGTDPVEGAALAEAIIESLREKGVRLMATTHYAELKAYALRTQGVENACCEFDVKSLRPTYRLLIGVPGKSNAFAIAGRLGLPETIVETGPDPGVGREHPFFRCGGKTGSRPPAAGRRTAGRPGSRPGSGKSRTGSPGPAQPGRTGCPSRSGTGQSPGGAAVSQTRAQVDALLQEMDELRRQKNKQAANEQKARLRAGVRQLENTADPIDRSRLNEGYVLPRPLKKGDSVLIFDIDKNATCWKTPKTAPCWCRPGSSKPGGCEKPAAALGKTDGGPPAQPPGTPGDPRHERGTAGRGIRQRPAQRIGFAGQIGEEAIAELDLFLDHAMLSNLHEVTVIHGKGTGVLRTAVQQHLRHHKAVRSFRLGVYGEGESGVTIVELK